MSERVVYWRALADFSKIRSEARKTQKSIADLNSEVDELNESSRKASDSQDKLGASNRKAGDSFASTADKVTRAQKKQREETERATKATKDYTDVSAQQRLESERAARAAQREATAAEHITQAQKSLKQARLDQAAATRKVTAAERERNNLLKSETAAERDLLDAEKKLNRARQEREKRVNAVRSAEATLTRSQQQYAKLVADNAFEDAKAAADYEKAAKRRADADAAYQRQREKIAFQQDRLDARAKAQADRRQAETDARNKRADDRERARQERLLRDTQETNRKLAADEARLAGARAAAARASQYSAPQRDLSNISDRINIARQAINKKAPTDQRGSQIAAASALTRAENQLAQARAAEFAAAQRLTNAEEDLLHARATHESLVNESVAAEREWRKAVDESGAESERAVNAEHKLQETRRNTARAADDASEAEREFVRASNAVHSATTRTESAIRSTEDALRRVGREFNVSSGGGNGFINTMRRVRTAFEDADKAIGKVGRSLINLRWPFLAAGIYLVVQAISVLVGGLFELATAVAPAVGALAAAIPIAYALGGAFLSVKAAFSGIGGVLKAYQTEQGKAAVAGAKAAKTETNNADAIINAQQNLKDAREQVAITAKQGADQIAQASRSIVEAQQNELDAVKSLDDARKAAKKNIVDLKNAVVDAALAERGAALDLADAQANLQHVLNDPNSTRADRERAQLQVDQAAQSQKETAQSASQTRSDSQAATAAGVEGDSGVIQAKRQLADAIQAVTDAQKNYSDTVAETSRNNAKAVRAVADAQRALTKAQVNSNAATAAGGAAADSFHQKLSQLTPAARKFVEKLISMQKYWTALKQTAAANLFPGLTSALDRSVKIFPVIRSGIAIISRELGRFADNFAKMITTPRWISAFKQFNAAASPILRGLGDALLHIIDTMRAVGIAAIPLAKRLVSGFDAWTKSIDRAADSAQKSGRLGKFFEHSYDVLHALGQIIKNIGIGFYNMGKAASDSGKDMLGSIVALTKKWSDWTGSIQGQNELKKYFEGIRRNMMYLDHLIYRITVGFLHMGDSKNFKPILQALGDVFRAIKEAFGGQGNGVAAAFITLLHNIAAVIRSLSEDSSGLSVFIGTINLMLEGFRAILKIPGVPAALGAIFAAFAAFKALKLFGILSLIDLIAKGFTGLKTAAKGTAATVAAETSGLAAANTAAAGRGAAVGTAGVAAAALPVGASGRAPNRPGNPSSGKAFAATRPAAGAAAAAGAGEKAAVAGGGATVLSALGGKIKNAGKALTDFFKGASKYGKGGPWAVAIAAVAIAFVELYKHVKPFRDFVNKVFNEAKKFFLDMWHTIEPGIKQLGGAFVNLGKALKGLFVALFNAVKPLLPLLKIVGIALGVTLFLAFKALIFVIQIIVEAINIFAKVLAFAINNIVVPVIKVLTVIVNALGVTFKAVFEAIAAAAQWLGGVLGTVWNGIVAVFKTAAAIIWKIASVTFKVIAAVILAPIAGLIALFKLIWSKIGFVFIAALNTLKGWLTKAWNFIKVAAGAAWEAIKTVIVKPFTSAFNTLKSIFSDVWGWLKRQFDGASGDAGKLWGKIGDAIISAFGKIKGALSSIWDEVKSIFATAVNFVTQKILNPLISAINWVITKFGISKIPSIDAISVSTSTGGNRGGHNEHADGGVVEAHATGGTVRNVRGMVPGYTPGRDPHEFVSNTGYRVKLSGGEGILTPETTRALGGKQGIDRLNGMYTSRLRNRAGFGGVGSSAHADGGTLDGAKSGTEAQRLGYNKFALWRFIKDDPFGDSILDSLGGLAGKALGLLRKGAAYVIKGGFEAAEAPIRLLLDLIPGGNKTFLPKMINGLFNKVNKGVFDVIAGNNPKSKSSATGRSKDARYSGQITGSLAQNDIMISGLTLNNDVADVPLSKDYANKVASTHGNLLNALRIIIGSESGWNASAINLTDSNAKAGHPSQGLMQTIPSTYNAYANPNFNYGITDAVSNVTAGIGYADSRYGGVTSVPGVKAVNAGQKYVGYHSGGVIPGKQNANGSPRGLSALDRNGAIAALIAQSNIDFPATNSTGFNGTFWNTMKYRLAGIGPASEVSRTTAQPAVQNVLSGDSAVSKGLMAWTARNNPANYKDFWTKEPYYISDKFPNKYKRDPLVPLLSYLGNPQAWQNYQKTTDAAYWQKVAASRNRTATKQVTVAQLMKDNPGAVARQAAQQKRWAKDIALLQGAAHTEQTRVASLRNLLGLSGAGNNYGLFSADMTTPVDHAMAHNLGLPHPADWPHPWSGSVTATESALGASDRSNALNAEWFDDLNKIATWGYTDLVNYLLDKGVADGLSIARDAVKDQKTAKQLNDSIHAGLVSTGVSADDAKTMLQIVAKLGSGTSARPFGLRDVAAAINSPDYVPVNLFDQMLGQIKKLPDSLTKRFIGDVAAFRAGTFYARDGAIVPGDKSGPNKDSVHSMLVPGEGVLSRKAMAILGENAFNALNNGIKPQMFRDGGMIISPTFDNVGFGNGVSRVANSTYTRNNTEPSATSITLETNIYNPTGESSVLSQNKMLQRQAALGTIKKAAGVN